MASEVRAFPIERIHLYAENPRHGKISDPDKIIKHLLKDEQVFELAKSIAERTANPLELIGVVRIDDEDDSGEPTYEVWEGNRRVCAMMLLNDPDKAPPKWRPRFEELSKNIELFETIEGRVFDDQEELRFWMRNIHNGAQGGRGRKDWGPDEQHRDKPTRKNAIAFELLERAETLGLITSSQRRGSLTTLQRYVEKPALRQILQANDTDPGNVIFGRAESDFDKLLRKLIEDLKSGVISSRKNESQVVEYAETLEFAAGVEPACEEKPADPDRSQHDGEPNADSPNADEGDNGDESDDKDDGDIPRPKPATKLKRNKELVRAIENLGSDKLANLYHSITSINAKTHPQLVAVGAWSLLETCAALCGATEKNAFNHYFSKGMMGKMGVAKRTAGAISDALERLAKGGNTTKHDAIAGTFDYRSLINDMERVSSFIAEALTDSTD